jgi:hypothetical protein
MTVRQRPSAGGSPLSFAHEIPVLIIGGYYIAKILHYAELNNLMASGSSVGSDRLV